MISYGYGIELGPLRWDNIECYRVNRNDEAIRRWCRQRGLIDEISQRDWYVKTVEDPHVSMFEILSENQQVGVCGLTDINLYNRRAEFSLYINVNRQGRGYSVPALKTLCRHGFDDLNLNLIWGETVGNNPAEKIFKKCGFTSTGYRPSFYYKDGKYHDSNIYVVDSSSFNFKFRDKPDFTLVSEEIKGASSSSSGPTKG